MMIMLPRSRLGDAYSLTEASHLERVRREHDNVAAAVIAGDPDTARAAMRVHLGNSRRRLDPDGR
jgi:GntR family transcriptional repressor for pyruvate dehydrogenase complex